MTTVPLRNGKKATWRYKTQVGMVSKALKGERGCVRESSGTDEGFYVIGAGDRGRWRKNRVSRK